jgi:uncharacterized membrane protein YdbT with pleckstrin-like domain
MITPPVITRQTLPTINLGYTHYVIAVVAPFGILFAAAFNFIVIALILTIVNALLYVFLFREIVHLFKEWDTTIIAWNETLHIMYEMLEERKETDGNM